MPRSRNEYHYYRPAPVRQHSGPSHQAYRWPSPRRHRNPESVEVQNLEERLRRLKNDDRKPSEHRSRNHDTPVVTGDDRERRHHRDSGYHEYYYPDDEGEEYYPDDEYVDYGDYHDHSHDSESERDPKQLHHDHDLEYARNRTSRRPPPVREVLIGLASDIFGEFTKHSPLFGSKKSHSHRTPVEPEISENERVRTLTPSPAELSEDEGERGVNIDNPRESHKLHPGSKISESVRVEQELGFPPPLTPEGYAATKQKAKPEMTDKGKRSFDFSEPTHLRAGGSRGENAAAKFKHSSPRVKFADTEPPLNPENMFSQYGYNQIPPEVWKEDVSKRPKSPSAQVSPLTRALDSTAHQQDEAINIARAKKHRSHDGHRARLRRKQREEPDFNNSESDNDSTNSEAEGEGDDEPYSLIYTPKDAHPRPFCVSESETSYESPHRQRKAASHNRHKNKSRKRAHRGRHKSPSSHSLSSSPSLLSRSSSRSLSASRRQSRDGSTNRDLKRYPAVPKHTVERLEHEPLSQQLLPLLEIALEIIESLNDTVSIVTTGRRRSSLLGLVGPFAGERHRRRRRRSRARDSDFGVLRAWAMVRTLKRVRKEISRRRKVLEKEKGMRARVKGKGKSAGGTDASGTY